MQAPNTPKQTPVAVTALPLLPYHYKPIPKNFPIDAIKPGQSFLWNAKKTTVILYIIAYKRRMQNKGILVNFKVTEHADGVRVWRTL